ncbi:MAG: sialate O-acetylesterase [Opitutales bacterium]
MKIKKSLLLLLLSLSAFAAASAELKTHAIFTSNMVLQRDKPIMIWGWADESAKVSVQLGDEVAEATATGEKGRWEVTFPARPASADPIKLTVRSGGEMQEMENIVMGDVWVMNGQSNMAWALGKTQNGNFESLQAHQPLLRRFKINSNEQASPQVDIPADKIADGGWVETDPETARAHTAIGYAFGSRLQRATQVPIGLIENARGGASLESLVPLHKFDDHPLAAAYKAQVDRRIASFDPEALALEKWERALARAKSRGQPEDKWPKKPEGAEGLRSWDIPGMSPSDAGSCYNGMFGVFKGLNIKGVLFHQGYNNAMTTNCRPKRYRVLMQLMVEGWREDFKDPDLAVGVIGFCAGSIPQTAEMFEEWSVSPGAYIREAQRLGLADAGNTERTAFLPAYDVQIPGLHPSKKRDHGTRAARWALSRIYGERIKWEAASLVSKEVVGDTIQLTFDKSVIPDDMSLAIEGFSIAGEDGRFYKAYATWPLKEGKDPGKWKTANKSYENDTVIVWSPLVEQPVAVRYAWATSPMGNLKVSGMPWLPLHSFRTDDWDWPESEDPDVDAVTRASAGAMNKQATANLEARLAEEAERAPEIRKRLEALGR